MSTEEEPEIQRLNLVDNVDRIGDKGCDRDGNIYIYTDIGWLCINEDLRDARKWRKLQSNKQ